MNDENKKWKSILHYWFAANTNAVSNRLWDNTVPHAQSMEDIPLFFRKCLQEFKDYYAKHRTPVNALISSKIIYGHLISELNHTPAAVLRYPEMKNFLFGLQKYTFLDPYLRQFLYKLYHCKLYFKRYRLNINDMINFGQKCLLCNNAIDTPKHLFERCEVGNMLRAKRDIIFSRLNF